MFNVPIILQKEITLNYLNLLSFVNGIIKSNNIISSSIITTSCHEMYFIPNPRFQS